MGLPEILGLSIIIHLALKLLKWFIILMWPMLILEGCLKLFGSSVASMSDDTQSIFYAISIIIGFVFYKLATYRG
jgi:hypothetical protein